MNAKAALEEVRKLVNEHFRSPEDDTKPISRIREVLNPLEEAVALADSLSPAVRKALVLNCMTGVTASDLQPADCKRLADFLKDLGLRLSETTGWVNGG